MKSGLEDRNNLAVLGVYGIVAGVSMKSGLEDRNNGETMNKKWLEKAMSQ